MLNNFQLIITQKTLQVQLGNSISVDFNKNKLKSSESFQATLKVSGNGNLKLFSLPKLTAPSSLEIYDPEHKGKY